MRIDIDDLRGQQIAMLLEEHQQQMRDTSPPESCHVLDLESLRAPDITFWSAWEGEELMGCGALKALGEGKGEIKSMRTATRFRGKGVASRILETIIEEAKRRGYQQLVLETGSRDVFRPARELYLRFGFATCPPFEPYEEDPESVFMRYVLC